DSAGNSAVVIVCAVVGACAGGYTGYRIAEANGYTGWKKAGAIAGGAGIGAAICGVGSFYTEKYVSSIAFASGKLVSPNFDYEKIENHLFNKKHNLDALFRTGDTNATVMKRIMDMALNCSNQWVEGSNDLRTTIDGMDVTIRFYVQNGQLQNLNCFRGISERSINNLIVK
ncbi:MAG: hypothetical protein HUJ80_04755, partial [Firmicutes bacterium]|nr:hypothetical protein [Bacillota bacterium]